MTLVSSTKSKTRSVAEVNTNSYVFTYTNIWNVTYELFKVTMTCEWINDGYDSKINVLTGVYEIIKDGCWCEWTDSYYCETNSWLEMIGYRNISSYMEIRFVATLVPMEEPYFELDYISF